MGRTYQFSTANFEGKTAEDLMSNEGGGGLPAPGKAQFLITAVEDRTTDAAEPKFSITCEIEAHEDESQVGKTSYNFFVLKSLNENPQKAARAEGRVANLALATGVWSERAWNEAQVTGDSLPIDMDQFLTKRFLGTLEAGSYKKDGKDKQTCRVEWDFVSLQSPKAANYPRIVNGKIMQPSVGEPAAPPSAELKEEDIPF